MEYQVIVIGGGPAGISALLWCHSLGLSALMLEQAPELGGQMLQMFHPVLEYPGFPNATGHELRDQFAAHLHTYDLKYQLAAKIEAVDTTARRVVLKGENLQAQAIIIATGARNRTLGFAEEERFPGTIFSQSATRDAKLFSGKEVVVVGGGDSAFEDCLILAESCPRVTLLHRSENFRARKSWQESVLANPKIQVQPNCEIISIAQLSVEMVELTVKNHAKDSTEKISAGGVFVRLGIQPNTDFLRRQIALDEAGYVVTNQAQQTSVEWIYAVGDVCRPVCLSVATAIGHGAIAAKDIALRIKAENY